MYKEMTIENLKFTMQRIDSNIDRTNTKSTILLGLTTFAFGAFSQNLKLIKNVMLINNCSYVLVIISIFGLALTSYFAITAIVPIFPKKNSKALYKSLIYYGSISNFNDNEYCVEVKKDSYNFEEDLCRQIVENSKIAYKKFIYLSRAFRSLIFMVILPWLITLIFFVVDTRIIV